MPHNRYIHKTRINVDTVVFCILGTAALSMFLIALYMANTGAQ